jgi:hypothetical protein
MRDGGDKQRGSIADASMPKPHILQSQHFQYFFNEFHYPQYDW